MTCFHCGEEFLANTRENQAWSFSQTREKSSGQLGVNVLQCPCGLSCLLGGDVTFPHHRMNLVFQFLLLHFIGFIFFLFEDEIFQTVSTAECPSIKVSTSALRLTESSEICLEGTGFLPDPLLFGSRTIFSTNLDAIVRHEMSNCNGFECLKCCLSIEFENPLSGPQKLQLDIYNSCQRTTTLSLLATIVPESRILEVQPQHGLCEAGSAATEEVVLNILGMFFLTNDSSIHLFVTRRPGFLRTELSELSGRDFEPIFSFPAASHAIDCTNGSDIQYCTQLDVRFHLKRDPTKNLVVVVETFGSRIAKVLSYSKSPVITFISSQGIDALGGFLGIGGSHFNSGTLFILDHDQFSSVRGRAFQAGTKGNAVYSEYLVYFGGLLQPGNYTLLASNPPCMSEPFHNPVRIQDSSSLNSFSDYPTILWMAMLIPTLWLFGIFRREWRSVIRLAKKRDLLRITEPHHQLATDHDVFRIMVNLDLADVAALSLTCRQTARIFQNDTLWRELLKRDFQALDNGADPQLTYLAHLRTAQATAVTESQKLVWRLAAERTWLAFKVLISLGILSNVVVKIASLSPHRFTPQTPSVGALQQRLQLPLPENFDIPTLLWLGLLKIAALASYVQDVSFFCLKSVLIQTYPLLNILGTSLIHVPDQYLSFLSTLSLFLETYPIFVYPPLFFLLVNYFGLVGALSLVAVSVASPPDFLVGLLYVTLLIFILSLVTGATSSYLKRSNRRLRSQELSHH